MKTNYISWFKKVINICIYLFFIFSFVSTLFVFGSQFNGLLKYATVAVLAILLLVFIYFIKDKIRIIFVKLLNSLEKIEFKYLLLIIVGISLLLKIIYSIFFYFDSTLFGGDITIYSNIASEIANNGFNNVKDYIYYLVGVGTHLSLFNMLNIPYHIGVYIVVLVGIIANFFSFSKLIGKEKSFILIVLYILMPSTNMLTFCITHELFVFMYFSIIMLLLTKLILSEETKYNIIFGILLLLFISLNQTVSPMGKLWFIVLAILVLLTNLKLNKKIILCVVLALSILFTNILTTRFESNNQSQSNNYEQLLIGCDYESMGRHTDGRGKRAAKKYFEEKGIELTYDNLLEGEKGALIEEYKYLLTHPVKLLELLANKFYTAWSGDYYSIEYGYKCDGINSIGYYVMLVISALIWLFVITLGIVYYDKEEDNFCVSNYKLIILGVASVLLIVEICNKYSCYMTIFIYFIAFARAKLKGE